MRSFSEFNEDKPLEGKKISIEDVLNVEIEVLAYKIRQSRYARGDSSTYVCIQIRLHGNLHVIFSGSIVLSDQLTKYGDKLPYLATIKKIGNYYTLT